MLYKNARIYCPDGQFRTGAFEVTADGRFGAVLPKYTPTEAIDLQGATVIPGLVDIHTHGACGSDFSDGDPQGLEAISRYLARSGITSFAPTSMTLPYSALERAFASACQLADNRPADCARVIGIHMEGPYFSEKKKGAQNGAFLKAPDPEGFRNLYNGCNGLIRIVDIAPELPGSVDFIREVSDLCRVSVAHTDAGYEEAKAAFSAGAGSLTHLFNAMPPIHHRDPGVIPAAAESTHVFAELICDGLHVHPASVRLAYSLFGPDRLILVSDSLRCCGMPDGRYSLGGQDTFLAGGVARLADGTLAGSATNLFECMKNAIRFGIPEAVAVAAATRNPAKALGAEDRIGTIAPGLSADFLICSADYSEKKVYLGGAQL